MTSSCIDPDDVIAELERRQRDGTLMRIVTQSYPCYQASPTYPNLLEEISADGTRILGQFKDNEFKALPD